MLLNSLICDYYLKVLNYKMKMQPFNLPEKLCNAFKNAQESLYCFKGFKI